MNLFFNPAMNDALDFMENTPHNLFITGKAGTGKSTLLTYFRRHTKKKVVVLAPTGVAAINVQGQTIHSFFKFKHSVTLGSVRRLKENKTKKSIYKQLDMVIIDEISMVRADLIDCVDKFLRLNGKDPTQPFGGVQMIFIGDLYQLPPVVTSQEKEIFLTQYQSPYFFSAHFFDKYEMIFIELDQIFRQQDDRFIQLLNAVRDEKLTEADMGLLNERVRPGFQSEEYVCLTPKNSDADAMNARQLNALPGKPFTAEARIEGTFGKEYYPTRQTLTLKKGARVMMTNNDSDGLWVNGTMGTIRGFERGETGHIILVDIDGKTVEVSPHKWEINRFFLDAETIKTEVIGSFTQYPLTLAWALTIHKSQGKTFQKVMLDIGGGAFMSGQVYVALSRCTSLEGLILKKPIYPQHIWSDREVITFLSNLDPHIPTMQLSMEERASAMTACLEKQQTIEITYLNATNEKSRRLITPSYVGWLKHQNIAYMGMKGFCHTSQENKVFRLDRIMGMAVSG